MGPLHPTTLHSYLAKSKQPQSIMRAKLPFMTRLPKKRGITQVEEDKSLILRSFHSLRLIHLFPNRLFPRNPCLTYTSHAGTFSASFESSIATAMGIT